MVVLSTTHYIVYDSEWIMQSALKLFELSKEVLLVDTNKNYN